MKKVCIIFGTRPEAIKLAPLVKEMESRSDVQVISCALRQHGKMLDQVLNTFALKPTHMISVSFGDKALFGKGIPAYRRVWNLLKTQVGFLRLVMLLKNERPDHLVVQGDTSTAFLGAFLAFHFKISVVHVEAGLRTGDKYHPFPEEVNRRLISVLADLHCAPTKPAQQNLLSEGIPAHQVAVTGNTVIDAIRWVLQRYETDKVFAEQARSRLMFEHKVPFEEGKKLILLTAHRRENFGDNLAIIFRAIKRLAESRDDINIVYPVHANPNVTEPAHQLLSGIKNVHLTDPISYELFIYLMKESYSILTDSGGIQEEASQLGIPVLVLRTVTERQEAVEEGNIRLIPITENDIFQCATDLLDKSSVYDQMALVHNTYGDGKASAHITDFILQA